MSLVLIAALAAGDGGWVSPTAIATDGAAIYVAEATGNAVLVLNPADGSTVRTINLPEPSSGMALSADGKTLCLTNGAAAGQLRIVDAATGETRGAVAVGHTPASPVISPDGAVAYVCNQFTDDVSVIDLAAKTEAARVPAVREPVSAALTPDGKTLFVANLLPSGPSDGDVTAAAVSVIDTASRQAVATLPLPNGSTGVHGVCVSPDGKFAYVVHILAHYQLPTTQLERGWMNTNAMTIIDAGARTVLNTVLLDDVDLGAANPWAAACTSDGKYLCVAHAGSQEISFIDRAGLHAKLDKVASGTPVDEVAAKPEDVPTDLGFLVGIRWRVKVKGNGPRALAVAGTTAWVANYFSDSVDAIDFADPARARIRTVALTNCEPSPIRRGEMLFHDAQMCFQQWQSCASCHPDARVDGLNWDLMNDGLGNPKNTKSMLLAHQTPPAMSLGVREAAEVAVRAGIKFIQFAVRPEEDAKAIDEYLKALKPVPGPKLVNGQLSDSAKRGKEVFAKAGCAACHPEPLFTDLKQYDVGTTTSGLDAGKTVDTPTLVECWRTAPYLHDGSAATIVDVLKKRNPADKHGVTSSLTEQEIGDLAEYVLSQ